MTSGKLRKNGPGGVSKALLIFLFLLSSCSHRSDLVNDRRNEAKILNLRGNDMYFRGNYAGAAVFYDRALALAMEIDDRAGMAESLNNLGQLYVEAGDLPSAEEKFLKAAGLNDEIRNKKGQGANLNNSGNVLRLQGRHEEAAAEFKRALDLGREAGDKYGCAVVTDNMGLLALDMGENLKAGEFFKEALVSATKLKQHRLAAACLQNLASLAESEGRIDDAITNLTGSVAEDRLVENSPGIAKGLEGLGRLSAKKGEAALSQDYFTRAKFIRERLGYK